MKINPNGYLALRRTIKKDSKRIEKYKRDNAGRYTKKEKSYQQMFRNIQMFFGILFLLGYGFILLKPIEQYNPLVSIETTYAAEQTMPSNSNTDQADQLDKRIEECWAKNWQPMVLEQGFVCAEPAEEISTK